MIELYLRSHQDCYIEKEQVGGWFFSMLSSSYHDSGLNTYFNGSKVKGHSFYLEKSRLEKGNLVKIELRGIDIIEEIVDEKIELGEEIRIGKYFFTVYSKTNVSKNIKSIYDVKSPLIMRVSNLKYKHGDKFINDVSMMFVNSIKRKFYLIYGYDLKGLKSINLLDYDKVKFNIKIQGNSIRHTGFLGKVEIIGSDEAVDFILRVGLGNRTTYGYGVLG